MTLAVRDALALRPVGELADIANREHRMVEGAFSEALRHAIAAGEAIIAARQSVPKGTWSAWARENLTMQFRQLWHYQRIATYRVEIEAWAAEGDVERPTLQGAIQHLQAIGAKVAHRGGRAIYDDDMKAEVRRLREEGLPQAAIAAELGVTRGFVIEVLVPGSAERRRRYLKHRREEERIARHAMEAHERWKETRRLTKGVGGEIEKGYGNLRRALKAFDLAMTKTQRAETRRLINEAIRAALKAEAAIVDAMKNEASTHD